AGAASPGPLRVSAIAPYRWRASASQVETAPTSVSADTTSPVERESDQERTVLPGRAVCTNLGFLITTWLSAGSHTFVARATESGGATATDRVTATVATPSQPPADLQA